MRKDGMEKLTIFFKEYPTFCRVSAFLTFSDFKPRITLDLFINTKGLTSGETLRNIFQSLLF